MKEDLYKILDIDKGASDKEIKKAYRTKAKQHHPDKPEGDEVTFKKVSYAYEILSDGNKRAVYDSRGHDGLSGNQARRPSNQEFHDFVNNQRKEMQERQMKDNAEIRAHISMTIEDIFNGVTKTFEYNRRIICLDCDGDGGTNPARCNDCNGTGTITRIKQTQFGYMQHSAICTGCKGVGILHDNTCLSCTGKGISSIRERHSEEIEHGMLNGEYIVVEGKGNVMENGEYGDLVMQIRIKPHEKFIITHDYHLTSVVKVPYEILMLGGKVEFDTIDGSKVRFTVNKLSKVGTKLNLKDKGLKHSGYIQKFAVPRGDQTIILDIEIPTEISDEELELLEKIKKLKE